MFSTLANELRLQFRVEAAGPLVVRAGKPSGVDPTRPDMEFVRDGAGRVYLPGSSLKGVVRSRAERILRSQPGGRACNPFHQACGREVEKERQEPLGERRYRQLCHACRLFGSTALRGRAEFQDAPAAPDPPLITGQRHHVGIDRVTGGPYRAALFSPETVEQGAFLADVTLRNFALWQVILLTAVLRDMDDGFVGVGGGTTRGYGRVRLPAASFRVRWRDARRQQPARLVGCQEADVAPVPVDFRRGLYAWEAAWEGLDALLDRLGHLDLGRALAQDLDHRREGKR